MVVIFFLFVLCANNHVFPQLIEETILAKVGDDIIYKSEFENRLNFSPKIGIQDKEKSQGIKTELLYTMIAEKLWTNYAYDEGIDSEELSLSAKNVIEKMFIRDELYKKEIKDKINISDLEISDAFQKNKFVLKIKTYYSEDQSSIFNLYAKLKDKKKNTPINSDLVGVKDNDISYGDLPQDVEHILYNLRLDELSEPINNNGVWTIYELKDKIENKFSTQKEKNAAAKKIEKIIKERNENNRYDDFHARFFANKSVDVNSKLFKNILEELHSIFKNKFEEGLFVKNNNAKIVFFDKVDLQSIKENLGHDQLSQELIEFDEYPVLVSNFLNDLNILAFNVSDTDLENITNILNAKMKEYIKHELLAREGIRLGLDKSPNVQKWTKIWFDNYLFKTIKSKTLSSKSKRQLDNIFNTENTTKAKNIKSIESNNYENYVNKTIELSDKYNVEIDYPVLLKIKQGNINLFVVRHLGFGGTISGVPTTQPFIEWYLKKENKSKKYL